VQEDLAFPQRRKRGNRVVVVCGDAEINSA